MDVGWGEKRCIHCLGVPSAEDPGSVMTKGHVIPQSLGGKPYACNECKRRNERLGHGAEAALVGDLAVRSASETIADQIPDLIQRMRRRKVFIAQSDSGLLVRALRTRMSTRLVHPRLVLRRALQVGSHLGT